MDEELGWEMGVGAAGEGQGLVGERLVRGGCTGASPKNRRESASSQSYKGPAGCLSNTLPPEVGGGTREALRGAAGPVGLCL